MSSQCSVISHVKHRFWRDLPLDIQVEHLAIRQVPFRGRRSAYATGKFIGLGLAAIGIGKIRIKYLQELHQRWILSRELFHRVNSRRVEENAVAAANACLSIAIRVPAESAMRGPLHGLPVRRALATNNDAVGVTAGIAAGEAPVRVEGGPLRRIKK